MNEDIKRRWVAALRSGEYEQGSGYLKMDGKFCCLGVLCDLAERDGIVVSYQDEGDESVSFANPGNRFDDSSDVALPAVVLEWSGISEIDPMLHSSALDQTDPASTWNDDLQADFGLIANMIEESL